MAFKKKVKSGDSKLQDAHRAREKERIGEGPSHTDPREMREDLVNELEDAPEQHRARGDTERAERAEMLLGKLTEALEAMEKRVISLEGSKGSAAVAAIRRRKLLKCPTCHQQVYSETEKRGVCDGTHLPVMVTPSTMDLWPSFQGIRLNGAKYAGRHLLPPSIIDAVLTEVRRWETQERRKFIPGGKVFGNLSTGQFGVGQTAII